MDLEGINVTISALDPKTALIIIDLQNGIVSLPTAHPIADVVRRAGALAAAFRRRAEPNWCAARPSDPPVGRASFPSSIGSPKTTR